MASSSATVSTSVASSTSSSAFMNTNTSRNESFRIDALRKQLTTLTAENDLLVAINNRLEQRVKLLTQQTILLSAENSALTKSANVALENMQQAHISQLAEIQRNHEVEKQNLISQHNVKTKDLISEYEAKVLAAALTCSPCGRDHYDSSLYDIDRGYWLSG